MTVKFVLMLLLGITTSGWAITASCLGGRIRQLRHKLDLAEAQLEKYHRDPLTGLWNGAGFQHRVADAFWQHNALMLVEIADFDSVDARHGPGAGDEMLRVLASRLAAQFGTGALIGRDEHRLAVMATLEFPEFNKHIETIVSALQAPIAVNGPPVSVTAGIVWRCDLPIAEVEDSDLSLLALQAADIALEAARNAGESWCTFVPEQHSAGLDRIAKAHL